VQRLPHEQNLNKKSVLPKILKPTIKLKILSGSEADGIASYDVKNTINGFSSSLQIKDKIDKIRSIRGNNALLNKIKKQMELRKNFEEIFKEVEKKTAEIDKKIMGNQINSCKSSDKVFINKNYLVSSYDKNIKVIYYDYDTFKSDKKKDTKANGILLKILK